MGIEGNVRLPMRRRSGIIGRPRRQNEEHALRRPTSGVGSVHPLLQLHQTIGNRAIQRLVQPQPWSPNHRPIGSSHHTSPPGVQTKLRIGQPGDVYEREADRVAEQVMRMPDRPLQPTHPPRDEARIQSKVAGPQITPRIQPQGQPEEEEAIQSKRAGGRTPPTGPDQEARIRASQGGGQRLPDSVRSSFESKFRYDFSRVRIHTDENAARLSSDFNADAFTHGRNVYFGAGRYAPGTSAGRRLLAHELTHVVQQREALQRPVVQRQYRDCTQPITGRADANLRLENGRQRARGYIGAAIRALGAAPAAGTTYQTALNRHFVAPSAADRGNISTNYRQMLNLLTVPNFICNSQNICGGEQAFWIPQDDLIHVCRPFWPLSTTCRAIVLIHEAYHDMTNSFTEGAGYRGSAGYPSGNNPAPAGQTTALRMQTPDAYAFFAAHVWRNTDTGRTCF
jgi:hypothetical protein